MRVLSIPHADQFGQYESGIKRVVEAYFKYAAEFGIEYVAPESDSYDVAAVHAGMADVKKIQAPIVSICHGLYWTADLPMANAEWKANADVIASLRHARTITVPSEWVAETIRRDMRVNPVILHHGIEWDDWQHELPNRGHVLWNKNIVSAVCDPSPVSALASAFPDRPFVTTYAAKDPPANVRLTGVIPHLEMRKLVQTAAVYLGTTKETGAIGVMEALASGTPVLGYAWGANLDFVQHGVNGYLARPGDLEDLKAGLIYCVKHRRILSANARELAKAYTWRETMQKLAEVYSLKPEAPSVSVVIPCFNYGQEEKLGRAIQSAINQTYRVDRVLVVDDGSTDDGAARRIAEKYGRSDGRVTYLRQDNSGVAVARNHGIDHAHTKYICALDADDAIAPEFIRACVEALEADPSLGIAYTGITARLADGSETLSAWPPDFDYDGQLERRNSVPTCCVFRRVMWERLGGYRQRYAPMGCGAEDGELWLRAGAYGFNAKKVTEAGLFIYSLGTGRVSGNREYREVDYTQMHPWTKDHQHPFASVATPKKFSHPVRQYDTPTVSVIIPVGPGHEKRVIDALDSLESQTFRNWEAIVVDDTSISDGSHESYAKIAQAYPYVRWVDTPGGKGAGYARNRGAEIARAPLLLFLDCDDALDPKALTEMVIAYEIERAIIYSDHIAKSLISYEEAQKAGGRLLAYLDYKDGGEAVFAPRGLDYDYDRAVAQPNPEDMYIWCLISSLVPKKWHDAIGGFDEKMPSWEDWDYWLRMARAGRCFRRVPQPLVIYRYYSGTRRETGTQEYQNLIKYLKNKYSKDEPMPCACGKQSSMRISPPTPTPNSMARSAPGALADDDLVLVIYDTPNRASHRIVGQATGRDYQYRQGGERFYMDKRDQALMPSQFVVISDKPVVEDAEPPKETPPPGAVSGVSLPEETQDFASTAVIDLQTIPGVTAEVAVELNALGAHSLADIAKLEVADLTKIKTIGTARARTIIKYARDKIPA